MVLATTDAHTPGSGPDPAPGPDPVPDPGMHDPGSLVAASNAALARLAAALDPGRLSGPDAASLYRSLCAGTRRVVACKALLASRIEASGCFRDEGFATAPAYLASLEGTTDGDARRTLSAGRALASLPGVEEAARDGRLSAGKLSAVTEVAGEYPAAESELLSDVEDRSLAEIRARGRAVRNRHPETEAKSRMARIWRGRYFAHHADEDGAFCFRGRDTPERGARFLALLGAEVDALADEEETHIEGSDRTARGALRADALFGLVTGTGITGAGRSPARASGSGAASRDDISGCTTPTEGLTTPNATAAEPSDSEPSASGAPATGTRSPTALLVRVDLEALLRGQIHPGEVCDLEGTGPIPVPMARDLANDALLRLVFHRAGDIRAVVHHTRTINATLRTALEARDPTCVVPGCTLARNLEIDHIVPFVEGGPTSLDNLARLCRRHHFLKTYEGWTLTRTDPGDGAPTWSFVPMPAFGEEPGNRDDEGGGPMRQ